MSDHLGKKSLRSAIPIVEWLPRYERLPNTEHRRSTQLAVYAIPVSVAYASLAGFESSTMTQRRSRRNRFRKVALLFLLLSLIMVCGCEGLRPNDVASLLVPRFQRSELFGFLAGLGTTFAALPDLLAMLKRHSSAGMNPRMAAIMGSFQILWIYYGLLIISRPVIVWNIIAVFINFLSVGAYLHFARKEHKRAQP